MLERQGSSVIFYGMFIASKAGATGLTVTVDVWEVTRDGTATEIVTGGSATEIGDGLYRYLLAAGSVDADAEYIAVFKTADSSVDQQHIPAMWSIDRAGIDNLDAAVSSRAVAGDSMALTAAAVDAVLDETVEAGATMRQALRVLLAALAGEASGGGTATIVFRDLADTTDRITMTVDSSGNRSAVVLDLT